MNWLTVLTVYFVVLGTTCRKVDAYCYQGWTNERGKCYRVFNTTVTWQQAVRNCVVMDAALVMLDDITEQTFILQLKSTATYVNHWIGYYRNGTRWRWLQALNTSINHLNTTNIHSGEDCAAICKLGIWNPRKCEIKLPYICESETHDCVKSDGWFVYEKRCLHLMPDPSSWTDAREGCHIMGAELAVLKNVYKNGVSLMHHGVTAWTWIGLEYDYVQSQYVWLDGTPLSNIQNSISLQRSNQSVCGAMQVNETSQLVFTKGYSCNLKLQGLCEKIFTPGTSSIKPMTTTEKMNNRMYQPTSPRHVAANSTSVAGTNIGYRTATVLDSSADIIALLAQCLTDVDINQIDDCLRDVFMSYDAICLPESPLQDQTSYLPNLYNIEFYKNFVHHFGNFIEKSFAFSLCKKNNTEAFVLVEKILHYTYPRSNFSVNDRVQFHSEKLEIALNWLPPELERTNNALFDSYITGCLVTEVYKDTNADNIAIMFAVIGTDDVIEVDMDDSIPHLTAQHYLVSSVLMVTAYRSGRKTSVGLRFTIAYQTADDSMKNIHLNITQYELICAYYEPKRKVWSSRGCIVEDINTYTVICKCNHTTSFGVIMKIKVFEISRENDIALSVIAYIGCSVSMVTMFIALTVFTCIRSLNSERVFVHRNLCVAILFAQIVFLAAGKATRHKMVCRVTAVVLHYCFLSIFTWMLVEGLHLYTKVVQVFGTDTSRNSYYLCFGWGLPLVLVLISSAADWEGYGTKTSCWLSIDRKTIWAFVGPAVAVIVVNFVILVMVLRVVVSSAKTDRHSKVVQTRAAIKAALFLLHLLGLTWIFGLLAVNRQLIVFEYIFSLSNSLQGFFVFLFHCVLNTEVRQALRRVRERRAALNEDIQTVSLSSESDASSVAVEGTLRFRLSYIGGMRRCRKHYQTSWLKEEKLNREVIRAEGTEQTQKYNMSPLRRSNKLLTDDGADNLPLIYI